MQDEIRDSPHKGKSFGESLNQNKANDKINKNSLPQRRRHGNLHVSALVLGGEKNIPYGKLEGTVAFMWE